MATKKKSTWRVTFQDAMTGIWHTVDKAFRSPVTAEPTRKAKAKLGRSLTVRCRA